MQLNKEDFSLPESYTEVISIPVQEPESSPEANPETGLPGRVLQAVQRHPRLSLLVTALLTISISLGVWIIALHFQNRLLRMQLQDQLSQSQAQASDANTIQSRIEETRRQMTEIRGQIDEQVELQENTKESLGDENARLIGELNLLSVPQINQPTVALDPASQMQAGAEQSGTDSEQHAVVAKTDMRRKKRTTVADLSPVIQVPAEAQLFTFLLRQSGNITHPQFQLELLDRRNNKVIWSGQQKKNGDADLTLTLARRNYPAGKYRVRLLGLSGKKKEQIDQYDFQVQYLTTETVKGKKR